MFNYNVLSLILAFALAVVLVISFNKMTDATPLGGAAVSVCEQIYGEHCTFVGNSCGTFEGTVEGSLSVGVISIKAGGAAEFNCGVEGEDKDVELSED